MIDEDGFHRHCDTAEPEVAGLGLISADTERDSRYCL